MNKILMKMKIDTLPATIFGLVSIGLYWVFLLKKWLVRHQEYKELFYKDQLNESKSAVYINRSANRTQKNLKLLGIIKVLLIIGIVVFITESISELYFKEILFPEEPFWFYVWLVFSLFAVLLASIAIHLRKTTLEDETIISSVTGHEKPWLFKGNGKRIYTIALLNIVLALGLLPFIIFPPILSSAINKYVQTEESKTPKIN